MTRRYIKIGDKVRYRGNDTYFIITVNHGDHTIGMIFSEDNVIRTWETHSALNNRFEYFIEND